MANDIHRCAICAAEFESTAELVRHEREHHAHEAGAESGRRDDSRKPRSGHEFTRRNSE